LEGGLFVALAPAAPFAAPPSAETSCGSKSSRVKLQATDSPSQIHPHTKPAARRISMLTARVDELLTRVNNVWPVLGKCGCDSRTFLTFRGKNQRKM
jgi:hypothetical protein